MSLIQERLQAGLVYPMHSNRCMFAIMACSPMPVHCGPRILNMFSGSAALAHLPSPRFMSTWTWSSGVTWPSSQAAMSMTCNQTARVWAASKYMAVLWGQQTKGPRGHRETRATELMPAQIVTVAGRQVADGTFANFGSVFTL